MIRQVSVGSFTRATYPSYFVSGSGYRSQIEAVGALFVVVRETVTIMILQALSCNPNAGCEVTPRFNTLLVVVPPYGRLVQMLVMLVTVVKLVLEDQSVIPAFVARCCTSGWSLQRARSV